MTGIAGNAPSAMLLQINHEKDSVIFKATLNNAFVLTVDHRIIYNMQGVVVMLNPFPFFFMATKL